MSKNNSDSAVMELQVGGMDCAACAAAIEKAVCPLPGVREVRVDVMKGSVRVERDGSRGQGDQCPLILTALLQHTPAEWTETASGSLEGRYDCSWYEADPEEVPAGSRPWPQPEPLTHGFYVTATYRGKTLQLLGPYVDALVRVHGAPGKAKARKALAGLIAHLADHGLGTVSEIFDGDAPHAPRGCPAQAWSVGELLRAHRDSALAPRKKTYKLVTPKKGSDPISVRGRRAKGATTELS